MKVGRYEINCAAMAIVNYTNEKNKTDVATRQANNDECFDYVISIIEKFQSSEISRWKALYESMGISWEKAEEEVRRLKRGLEDPLRYY